MCPSGWVPGGTYNACYKFVSNPAPWDKANALCKDMGGTLAVIDTEQKASFITGYMLIHGMYVLYFMYIFHGIWPLSHKNESFEALKVINL